VIEKSSAAEMPSFCSFSLLRMVMLCWLQPRQATQPRASCLIGNIRDSKYSAEPRSREIGYDCEQDPDARPGAESLQRHEFVAGPHVNAASALLPLIQRSRSMVATLYAETDGPPKLPTGVE